MPTGQSGGTTSTMNSGRCLDIGQGLLCKECLICKALCSTPSRLSLVRPTLALHDDLDEASDCLLRCGFGRFHRDRHVGQRGGQAVCSV